MKLSGELNEVVPGLEPAGKARVCPYCGLCWATHYACSCIVTGNRECATCGGSGEVGPADPHTCPMPIPLKLAQAIATGPPIVVHPRIAARVRLTLSGTFQ